MKQPTFHTEQQPSGCSQTTKKADDGAYPDAHKDLASSDGAGSGSAKSKSDRHQPKARRKRSCEIVEVEYAEGKRHKIYRETKGGNWRVRMRSFFNGKKSVVNISLGSHSIADATKALSKVIVLQHSPAGRPALQQAVDAAIADSEFYGPVLQGLHAGGVGQPDFGKYWDEHYAYSIRLPKPFRGYDYYARRECTWALKRLAVYLIRVKLGVEIPVPKDIPQIVWRAVPLYWVNTIILSEFIKSPENDYEGSTLQTKQCSADRITDIFSGMCYSPFSTYLRVNLGWVFPDGFKEAILFSESTEHVPETAQFDQRYIVLMAETVVKAVTASNAAALHLMPLLFLGINFRKFLSLGKPIYTRNGMTLNNLFFPLPEQVVAWFRDQESDYNRARRSITLVKKGEGNAKAITRNYYYLEVLRDKATDVVCEALDGKWQSRRPLQRLEILGRIGFLRQSGVSTVLYLRAVGLESLDGFEKRHGSAFDKSTAKQCSPIWKMAEGLPIKSMSQP